MGKINTNRVILGGVVAGLILNIGEFVIHELLSEEMEVAMAALNLQPPGGGAIAAFLIMIFLLGIALVFVYAAIRPRFGAGPKTAIYAGLIGWFLVAFLGMGQHSLLGLFPTKLIVISVVWGLVEIPIASLVGAWLYKEE